MIFDIGNIFNLEKITHSSLIDGVFYSGFIYNKNYDTNEHITLYQIENNKTVRPDKKNIIFEKRLNKIDTIDNYDSYIKLIYTTYIMQQDDLSDNHFVPKMLGQITIEEFTLKGKLSRLDGAAVICSGYSDNNSMFKSEPIEQWFVNGKSLPENFPKYINEKKEGDWGNVMLLKVLSFDMLYGKHILQHN